MYFSHPFLKTEILKWSSWKTVFFLQVHCSSVVFYPLKIMIKFTVNLLSPKLSDFHFFVY